MDVSAALTDPEPGFTAFSVKRILYRQQNGTSVPTEQLIIQTRYFLILYQISTPSQ